MLINFRRSCDSKHAPGSINILRLMMVFLLHTIRNSTTVWIFSSFRLNLLATRFESSDSLLLFFFFYSFREDEDGCTYWEVVEVGVLAQRSLTLTGFLQVRLEGNRKVQGTVRLQLSGFVRLKKLAVSRVPDFRRPTPVVQPSMMILSIYMYKRWFFSGRELKLNALQRRLNFPRFELTRDFEIRKKNPNSFWENNGEEFIFARKFRRNTSLRFHRLSKSTSLQGSTSVETASLLKKYEYDIDFQRIRGSKHRALKFNEDYKGHQCHVLYTPDFYANDDANRW